MSDRSVRTSARTGSEDLHPHSCSVSPGSDGSDEPERSSHPRSDPAAAGYPAPAHIGHGGDGILPFSVTAAGGVPHPDISVTQGFPANSGATPTNTVRMIAPSRSIAQRVSGVSTNMARGSKDKTLHLMTGCRPHSSRTGHAVRAPRPGTTTAISKFRK